MLLLSAGGFVGRLLHPSAFRIVAAWRLIEVRRNFIARFFAGELGTAVSFHADAGQQFRPVTLNLPGSLELRLLADVGVVIRHGPAQVADLSLRHRNRNPGFCSPCDVRVPLMPNAPAISARYAYLQVPDSA